MVPEAVEPSPYEMENGAPADEKVADAEGSKTVKFEQIEESHPSLKTQRSDEPVSSATVNCWAGVPMEISAAYWES